MNDNLLLNANGGDSKRTKTFKIVAKTDLGEKTIMSNIPRSMAKEAYRFPCKWWLKKIVDEETNEDVTEEFID